MNEPPPINQPTRAGSKRTSFDRLARPYWYLERIAFGRDLERARFHFLAELSACRAILILGEGDGRCLARLLRLAPAAHFHCVDISPGMLAATAARLAPADRSRVTFTEADALALTYPPGGYDAVVTLFFLDCFQPAQVEALVGKIATALRPEGCWLYADFALPPHGWRRWRANLWLAMLYAFFRWQTHIPARRLPDAESVLGRAGFRPAASASFQAGLLQTALFRRGP